MALPPGQLSSRPARLPAQQRRRRVAAFGAVVVVVGGVAVAVASAGGGSSSPRAAPVPTNCRDRAACGSHPVTGPPAPPQDGTAAAIGPLISLGLPIYCGGTHGNAVAFTFDDGPGIYTHYAVSKLEQSGQRATFFAVGKSIGAWPGWLVRELRVGTIADHTYTHPQLTALSPDAVRQQLASTKEKIEAQTGQPVNMWRPPYGARSATIDHIGQSLGMLEILWSTDSADSLGADWDGIIRNVESGLRPGAIILMHENRGQTIRALTTLLPELRRRHLRSVTLAELLATDPPSLAQVREGPNGCSGAVKLRGSGG